MPIKHEKYITVIGIWIFFLSLFLKSFYRSMKQSTYNNYGYYYDNYRWLHSTITQMNILQECELWKLIFIGRIAVFMTKTPLIFICLVLRKCYCYPLASCIHSTNFFFIFIYSFIDLLVSEDNVLFFILRLSISYPSNNYMLSLFFSLPAMCQREEQLSCFLSCCHTGCWNSWSVEYSNKFK